MLSLTRRLSLAVLIALLAAALPAARPAHAQTFSVNSTADSDNATCPTVCTLREAIRRANENPGPDTITFSIGGAAPFLINVTSALPALTGGETSIIVSPAHSVVLSGVGLGTSTFGLRIMSADNLVRGLVIVGFPGSLASNGGSGIALSTAAATRNVIANNWIGLNADGTTTFGNGFYGVQIDQGASNNTIGGAAAGDGNVITGNQRANIAVEDSDSVTTASEFISGNQIIGNYIGTTPAGTAVPGDVSQNKLFAGVYVGTYARSTLIKDNVIGGHLGDSNLSINTTAGIVVASTEASVSSSRHPQDTTIIGNAIGVAPGGANIANHNGISLTGGAINTVIGDPADPVGGRNLIGFSQEDGILLSDNAYNVTGTRIVGNYIGLAGDGSSLATIGTASVSSYHNTAIYLGTVTSGSPTPSTIIGPANVIASARRFGIRVRSSGNTIKGNFIGTNAAGTTTSVTSATDVATVGYSFGDPAIWVENGSGNQIGGPSGGDRNVIAAGSSSATGSLSAILLMPGGGTIGGCSPAVCSVTATSIQGNYLGVSSTGTAALVSAVNDSSEGLRITNNISSGGTTAAASGNTVSGNVISGLGYGITLDGGANNNTLSGNRIGTRASGSLVVDFPLAQAIRNKRDGIRLLQGTGNQITNNTIAFNGDAGTGALNYYGIIIDNTTGGANGNTLSGNTLVRNGDGTTNSGIYLNGPTGTLITKTTTSNHRGVGVTFGAAGTNGGIAAPTLSAAGGTLAAATLSGSASCSSGNCTVEVFTSSVSEDQEGPVYLTAATTSSGAFSINITGCQRYLTATVRDNPSNNTSPFSAVLDSGALGPCADSSFSLGAAAQPAQTIFLGSAATYAHSITNNAAIARTFSVVIASDKGWASGPAQVTVPASSSASFNVTVGVPYTAQAGDKDTTTVQVFSGTTGSNTVTDSTTAKLLTLNPASPAVSPGQTKARTGATLTFTHSVTNTGDLAGTFAVVGPSGSGLPTFTGTPPTGWTIASAILAQTSLAGGASTTLTIVVNTPAGAPAGSVPFSFRIKVGTAQTDPATVDTISVPVARSFTFVATNPTGAPPTLSRTPGATADFVYTITNTGNASDSFQVPAPANAAPLSFSVSPSGSFSLAAGASRTVTVSALVASGAGTGDRDFSVTAVAVGGTGIPTAPAVAGRVTVTGGGTPQITFGAATPATASAAGDTVTFAGTLTNTGNVPAPFTFGTPAVTGSPAGWSGLVLYDGTCDTSISLASLAANASCTFTLQVTVPAGANGGPQAVSLSATANNSGQSPPAADSTASATATVNVAIMRSVSLSAASTPQEGDPGTVLTYTHTLTNLGNATDSFNIAVAPTAPASPGMAVLSPTVVTGVPRNGTRMITLVVTVPGGVAAGDLTFTVTATSQGSAGATASQVDVATIRDFDAASLSPGTSKNGLPGTSVTFTHTLTNTGSTAIAYDIAASNSEVSFGTPTVTPLNPIALLNPGETTTISVRVDLPLGVVGGTANITTVEVRKAGGGPLLASASNTSRVGNTYDVQITPDRSGTGYPNASLVFTHTVTNIGITPDTYTITGTNALGWPMGVVPNVLPLAPGESQVIAVTIDVPNDDNTQENTNNVGLVRVVSNASAETSHDEASENILVGKVISLVLSADQARVVTPSSGTIQMNDLVLSNTGNASETVDFTVLGADSGWAVSIMPFDILGPRDTDYNVSVSVRVPRSVQPGPTKVITVQARSRFDPTVVAEVRLRFVYIAPEVAVTYRTYLPFVRR